MSTMVVKPAPGLKIRDPERQFSHLPEDGSSVPMSQYWLHRVRDGDVLVVEQPAPTAAKSAQKK